MFFPDRLCDGPDLFEQRLPVQLHQPILPHERQGDGQRHPRDGGQPLHQVHRGQEGHTAEAHTGTYQELERSYRGDPKIMHASLFSFR